MTFSLFDTLIIYFFSVDPFSKKDWYDVKAPSNFEVRNIGKTVVTRTIGTSKTSFFISFMVSFCLLLVVVS